MKMMMYLSFLCVYFQSHAAYVQNKNIPGVNHEDNVEQFISSLLSRKGTLAKSDVSYTEYKFIMKRPEYESLKQLFKIKNSSEIITFVASRKDNALSITEIRMGLFDDRWRVTYLRDAEAQKRLAAKLKEDVKTPVSRIALRSSREDISFNEDFITHVIHDNKEVILKSGDSALRLLKLHELDISLADWSQALLNPPLPTISSAGSNIVMEINNKGTRAIHEFAPDKSYSPVYVSLINKENVKRLEYYYQVAYNPTFSVHTLTSTIKAQFVSDTVRLTVNIVSNWSRVIDENELQVDRPDLTYVEIDKRFGKDDQIRIIEIPKASTNDFQPSSDRFIVLFINILILVIIIALIIWRRRVKSKT